LCNQPRKTHAGNTHIVAKSSKEVMLYYVVGEEGAGRFSCYFIVQYNIITYFNTTCRHINMWIIKYLKQTSQVEWIIYSSSYSTLWVMWVMTQLLVLCWENYLLCLVSLT